MIRATMKEESIGEKRPDGAIQFYDAVDARRRLRRSCDDSSGHATQPTARPPARFGPRHRSAGELSLQGIAGPRSRRIHRLTAGPDRWLRDSARRTPGFNQRGDRGRGRSHLPEHLPGSGSQLQAQRILPRPSRLDACAGGDDGRAERGQRRRIGGFTRAGACPECVPTA